MIRRIGLWSIAGLLVLLAVAGCGLGGPRLQGKLLDATTGEPLTAGSVAVGELVSTLGKDGAYAVSLELGQYSAVAQAPGYVTATQEFGLTEQEKERVLDFTLEPRMLTGSVLAADTGEPVPGVELVLGDVATTSDASGAFGLTARVTADLVARGQGIAELTMSAAEVEALFSPDGKLLQPLEVRVQPHVLTGVLKETDGTPISGMSVSVGDKSTVTDAQGAYKLRFVPMGEPITIAQEGYRPAAQANYEGQAEYSLTLDPYVAVVQVSEEGTGQAMQGAAILIGQEAAAETDADGMASVRVMPDTELTISALGYLTGTVTFAGDADSLSVALTPTLIQGTLTEKDSGVPVENALVQVFRGEDSQPELLRTDAEGHYLISDATQVTRLFIKAPGYLRQDVPVSGLGTMDIVLEPFVSYGIYIPFGLLAAPDAVYGLLDMVANSNTLNTVVIDVKGDWAQIAWPSNIPLAQEIGAYVPGPMDMDELLAAAKERNIYTVARIVTFKDRLLAEQKPNLAIHVQNGGLYHDGEDLPWTDPFIPEVWEYNIAIGLEAIEKGFDEVQFDYLRFPSEGRVSDRVYVQEATFDTRIKAMQDFCAAAYAAIEPTRGFVSADVFGLTMWVDEDQDMGIGQRLEDVASHMDYISPMLYPQTFNPANLRFLGISDVELYPYEVLYYSVERTRERTSTLVRPWLQHYSGRYPYGLDELLRQRKGAEDAGSTGWLFWNAKGNYLLELFDDNPYRRMPVIPTPPPDGGLDG